MRRALELARGRLGRVWPNPAVGCVLAVDGVFVAEGATGGGGRPHGEVRALEAAGDQARGATAYVTLEPCSHWGRTPPCTEALIAAGVSRVVVAMVDPDPRVNGTGLTALERASIQVEVGLLEPEALQVNVGFLTRLRRGRPFVAVGTAHEDTFDAILRNVKGTDTVEATVVHPGAGPARFWVSHPHVLAPLGVVHLPVVGPPTPPAAVLAALGEQGFTRVMVPSDDPWAEELFRASLVDDAGATETSV